MAQSRVLTLLSLICMCFAGATAAEPLPAGPGLAAKHPGDRGIAQDADVLFADDFESGTVAEIAKRWGEMSNKGGDVVELADDSPAGSGGRRAIQMTARLDHNTGGHLYTTFDGVDQAYARFYVTFADEPGYIHHFVHFGGYRPATRWPQGGAGDRPRGDDRVTVGIEPFGHNGRTPPPGDWNFYTYWHEMKKSADGRYWGNALQPPTPRRVPAGRWQCVELMMKLNTPGQRDGELALWLDGEPVMHIHRGVRRDAWTGLGFHVRDDDGGEPFEGFDFRTNAALKINFFWLLHYVTDDALRRNGVTDFAKPNRVWFDNVVVARRYIGPITPIAGDAAPPQPRN
ncbi:MAG: hypothetical protein GC159_17910 [Phycisphaera sp.]|nr:hypothetical protein [Phycisphaera sp.]